MALGAHARVDQDLRHGILGGLVFFTLVGGVDGLNEVYRVVVGDVLQGISDALDEVVFLDDGHG